VRRISFGQRRVERCRVVCSTAASILGLRPQRGAFIARPLPPPQRRMGRIDRERMQAQEDATMLIGFNRNRPPAPGGRV